MINIKNQEEVGLTVKNSSEYLKKINNASNSLKL